MPLSSYVLEIWSQCFCPGEVACKRILHQSLLPRVISFSPNHSILKLSVTLPTLQVIQITVTDLLWQRPMAASTTNTAHTESSETLPDSSLPHPAHCKSERCYYNRPSYSTSRNGQNGDHRLNRTTATTNKSGTLRLESLMPMVLWMAKLLHIYGKWRN